MVILDTYEVALRLMGEPTAPTQLVLDLLQGAIDWVKDTDDLTDPDLAWTGALALTPVWNDEVWRAFIELEVYNLVLPQELDSIDGDLTARARSQVHLVIESMCEIARDLRRELES